MVGGSCGYENKTLTQTLSECQGRVRGIGVWLRGMRIPIQLALWLNISLSHWDWNMNIQYIFSKSEWAGQPFFYIFYIIYNLVKEVWEINMANIRYRTCCSCTCNTNTHTHQHADNQIAVYIYYTETGF